MAKTKATAWEFKARFRRHAFGWKSHPALERIDSSSGSIGSAVNGAIAELVPRIAEAPADAKTRDVGHKHVS